ncbi:MAG: hypothetical protein GY864_08865 [Desulfobacterales bacterium]|nr:hypothetical protein [Desulfobacterales bacterium]
MTNPSNATATLSSFFLESTESDRSSFDLQAASSTSLADYAPKPREIHLIGNLVPGWQIIKPLPLTIDDNLNGSYVSDNEFHVYGHGRTKAEALEDYYNSLVEYYQILAAEDNGPTQALFSRLQSFLIPTS